MFNDGSHRSYDSASYYWPGRYPWHDGFAVCGVRREWPDWLWYFNHATGNAQQKVARNHQGSRTNQQIRVKYILKFILVARLFC